MADRNLTLKYTYDCQLPPDLSTVFFRATQIPHVKCFPSGRFIVVGLADRNYLQQHASPENTAKLGQAGFKLVESPEERAQRTVVAFRPHRLITERSPQDLKETISSVNEVKVDEVQLLQTRAPILKIRLASKEEASILLKNGVKVGSIMIPAYSLETERYWPVEQCTRCYKFDHLVRSCPEATPTCSKCGERGHSYRNCSAATLKCCNCLGEHTAISFSCPKKKEAQRNQNTETPTPLPQQAPSTPPAPLQETRAVAPASYAAAAASPPTPSPDLQAAAAITSAKVQACAAAAATLSRDNPVAFSHVFPHLLEANNLPSIIIPPTAIILGMRKYPLPAEVPAECQEDPTSPAANQEVQQPSSAGQEDQASSLPIVIPENLPVPPSPASDSSDEEDVEVCSQQSPASTHNTTPTRLTEDTADTPHPPKHTPISKSTRSKKH